MLLFFGEELHEVRTALEQASMASTSIRLSVFFITNPHFFLIFCHESRLGRLRYHWTQARRCHGPKISIESKSRRRAETLCADVTLTEKRRERFADYQRAGGGGCTWILRESKSVTVLSIKYSPKNVNSFSRIFSPKNFH